MLGKIKQRTAAISTLLRKEFKLHYLNYFNSWCVFKIKIHGSINKFSSRSFCAWAIQYHGIKHGCTQNVHESFLHLKRKSVTGLLCGLQEIISPSPSPDTEITALSHRDLMFPKTFSSSQ